MLLTENLELLNEKSKDYEYLSSDEMEIVKRKFGNNLGCSFKKDKNGYFCHTHRARSKSVENLEDFPQKSYDFICSTS